MKTNLITSNSLPTLHNRLALRNPIPFSRPSNPPPFRSLSLLFPNSPRLIRSVPILSSNATRQPTSINEQSSNFGAELGADSSEVLGEQELERNFSVQVGNPVVPSFVRSWAKLSLGDQALFLLSFLTCTTCVAFMSLVVAAVPTLYAMGRAATSFAKLADTAREELPGTMAAIRLSGMEISDLTLELSDLSQEISDGVNKSAQAVQAAEAGIRQIGTIAHQHTVSLQPVVAGAAKKTSRAVGQATKTFLNIISRGSTGNEYEDGIDRVEI